MVKPATAKRSSDVTFRKVIPDSEKPKWREDANEEEDGGRGINERKGRRKNRKSRRIRRGRV